VWDRFLQLAVLLPFPLVAKGLGNGEIVQLGAPFEEIAQASRPPLALGFDGAESSVGTSHLLSYKNEKTILLPSGCSCTTPRIKPCVW
jgi:hypothetical protein